MVQGDILPIRLSFLHLLILAHSWKFALLGIRLSMLNNLLIILVIFIYLNFTGKDDIFYLFQQMTSFIRNPKYILQISLFICSILLNKHEKMEHILYCLVPSSYRSVW